MGERDRLLSARLVAAFVRRQEFRRSDVRLAVSSRQLPARIHQTPQGGIGT